MWPEVGAKMPKIKNAPAVFKQGHGASGWIA